VSDYITVDVKIEKKDYACPIGYFEESNVLNGLQSYLNKDEKLCFEAQIKAIGLTSDVCKTILGGVEFFNRESNQNECYTPSIPSPECTGFTSIRELHYYFYPSSDSKKRMNVVNLGGEKYHCEQRIIKLIPEDISRLALQRRNILVSDKHGELGYVVKSDSADEEEATLIQKVDGSNYYFIKELNKCPLDTTGMFFYYGKCYHRMITLHFNSKSLNNLENGKNIREICELFGEVSKVFRTRRNPSRAENSKEQKAAKKARNEERIKRKKAGKELMKLEKERRQERKKLAGPINDGGVQEVKQIEKQGVKKVKTQEKREDEREEKKREEQERTKIEMKKKEDEKKLNACSLKTIKEEYLKNRIKNFQVYIETHKKINRNRFKVTLPDNKFPFIYYRFIKMNEKQIKD
jgi:hypothetical protein